MQDRFMEPVGQHIPGARARLWRVGEGSARIRRFRLWFKGRLLARDGTDCGEYFYVKTLPVSPRHNGGEGFGVGPDGKAAYSPDLWLRVGYRPFNELPADWRAVNAKAQAQRTEIHAQKTYGPIHDLAVQTAESTKAIREFVDAQRDTKAARKGGNPTP